jgi:hypothetical protein
MELETNTPISNDARLLAQAKKLTLEPVHADITPEETPDSVIVANHLRDGAPANVSNDIEQDAPLITPVVPADYTDVKHSPKMYVLTGTGIVALAVVILLVVLSS